MILKNGHRTVRARPSEINGFIKCSLLLLSSQLLNIRTNMCNARALLYFVLARLRTINPYPNRLPHGHYSIHTSGVTLENICLVQDCCKSSALTIEYCFFALSHRCAYVGCPPTWEKVMRNRALFFISCVLSDTFLRKCNSTIWSKWTVHKPRSYISML